MSTINQDNIVNDRVLYSSEWCIVISDFISDYPGTVGLNKSWKQVQRMNE